MPRAAPEIPTPRRPTPPQGPPPTASPPLAVLNVRHRDTNTTAAHPVTHSPITLGRDADVDIRLDDPTVSRQHALLSRTPIGTWDLQDLESRNGIWLRDRRITHAQIIPGEPIRLGAFTLTLDPLADPSDADPHPHADADSPSNHAAQSEPSVTSPPSGHTTNILVITPDDPHRPDDHIRALSELQPPPLEPVHLRLLLDFGHELLTMPDRSQRYAALCRIMLSPELHGRSATIIRLKPAAPDKPPAVLSPAQSRPGDPLTEPYISRSVIKALLQSRQPILATNTNPPQQPTGFSSGSSPPHAPHDPHGPAPHDLSLIPTTDDQRIAVLACPIASETDRLDVLYTVAPPECGTPAWLHLAEFAARLFRQAEQNWLLRAASAEQAALNRELARARRIQNMLIPEHPAAPGLQAGIWFEPCLWVGGDYTDLIPLPHAPSQSPPALAVLADVSGKGLQAALVTATLHAATHAAVARCPQPPASGPAPPAFSLPDFVHQLNTYLCQTLPPGTFVTFLAVLLDPNTGKATLCNAGHPPPFLIDPQQRLTLLPDSDNPFLGVIHFTPVCHDFTLHPNHTLALYSDGLTEAANPQGHMLDIQGLAQLMASLHDPAADLPHAAQRLKDAINAHQSSAPTADDRTLLLLRRD